MAAELFYIKSFKTTLDSLDSRLVDSWNANYGLVNLAVHKAIREEAPGRSQRLREAIRHKTRVDKRGTGFSGRQMVKSFHIYVASLRQKRGMKGRSTTPTDVYVDFVLKGTSASNSGLPFYSNSPGADGWWTSKGSGQAKNPFVKRALQRTKGVRRQANKAIVRTRRKGRLITIKGVA